jgi:hypothetical protein
MRAAIEEAAQYESKDVDECDSDIPKGVHNQGDRRQAREGCELFYSERFRTPTNTDLRGHGRSSFPNSLKFQLFHRSENLFRGFSYLLGANR